ncbi:MAG TPA: hypothetical protein VKT29_15805 [Terriglobales bacterium]|nr:hypothetical protein [Terriglobales bacterium]
MLLAYHLVRLIERHADELANSLSQQVQESSRTADFCRHVPAPDLKLRVYEIYRDLGDWLLRRTEREIEVRYREIGMRRAAQGVPFSQLAYAIILTKENLWSFLVKNAGVDRTIEVYGELELLQQLDCFFDRAITYAAAGYEHSETAGFAQASD